MSKHLQDRSPEDELIEHYQSQQISSNKLHSILQETQAVTRKRNIFVALTASVLLMSMFVLAQQKILASQRTNMVLKEAALNHTSKLQMDSEAVSLVQLQKELHDLPFEIKLPESGPYSQLALVGGRYCTINGNLAAHLKLADPQTREQHSLFLTPSATNLKAMEHQGVEISGVQVKLWQEQDVVYAFATGESI